MGSHTVRELLVLSTRYLADRGVQTARLDAERLLAAVLGVGRLELYLEPDRRPSEKELEAFRQLLRRRGSREPAQYILGEVGFYELELTIDRRALVPRRETELLVDRALELIGSHQARVLELGTGSGCIALALASSLPAGSRIIATDISSEALELARENAARTGLSSAVEFRQGDLYDALDPSAGPFDLIVANLPYIPSAEIGRLMPEVRDYEPRIALDGGPDGLSVIRRAVSRAGEFLVEGGWLLLEVGESQAERVRALIEEADLEPGKTLRDAGGIERVVQGCKKPQKQLKP